MDFSLFFMPLKMKKPVFFTLDPVAALVYNRTDRWIKKKKRINESIIIMIMTNEIRTTINLCLKLLLKKILKKENKKRKWLFLYIKINSFQKNILDLVSKLF